jgi:hypothetical protein
MHCESLHYTTGAWTGVAGAVIRLDDQLVLGIKGTLSVVELKVMRQRLLAGQEAKARRGELFKRRMPARVFNALYIKRSEHKASRPPRVMR